MGKVAFLSHLSFITYGADYIEHPCDKMLLSTSSQLMGYVQYIAIPPMRYRVRVARFENLTLRLHTASYDPPFYTKNSNQFRAASWTPKLIRGFPSGEFSIMTA